jgi:ElaB/YqjD/DUF883 family membrane-anchored ribosome-binding protein
MASNSSSLSDGPAASKAVTSTDAIVHTDHVIDGDDSLNHSAFFDKDNDTEKERESASASASASASDAKLTASASEFLEEESNSSINSTTSSSPSKRRTVRAVRESAVAVASKTKATGQAVAHKTKKVLKKTESTIENNPWCLPLRWVVNFPRIWPRTSAIVFGVIVPLWMLIGVTMGFGVLLAQFESAHEIEGNDAILAARAQVQYYDVSALKLLNVTNVCLAEWERNVLLQSGDAASTAPILEIPAALLGNETAIQDYIANVNEAFLNVSGSGNGDGLVSINLTLLAVSLDQCTQSYLPELQKYQQATQNNSIGFDSLSFNWNRCWKYNNHGPRFIFYPTKDMIVAAQPDSQSAYFKQEWQNMQTDLYDKYLTQYGANVTSDEQYQAFIQSVQEASGGSVCSENVGGTSWFFFTIMTTVGT